VLLVLEISIGVGPDVLMTFSTFHYIWVLISGGYRLIRTMEFLAVALGTNHALLGPVDITRDVLILSEVFSTDTGTMAGNTVILHRGSLPEFMPGNKSPAHLIWSADMTLSTRRVALLTVVFKGCSQWGTLFQVTPPGFQNRFKTAERCVEANLVRVGDILVAGVTITFRGVGDKTNMGGFLIFGTAITAVTDNATNLPVGALNELGILQEDLLPYLQRR